MQHARTLFGRFLGVLLLANSCAALHAGAEANANSTVSEYGDTGPKSLRIIRNDKRSQADEMVGDAYTAYQTGELEQARTHYDRALALDPQHRDALLGRAAVYLQQRHPRAAGAIYRRLLAFDPRDGAALLGFSTLARSEDPSPYISHLRLLLREAPDSVPLNYALGNLLSRQRRWAEARQHFFTAFHNDLQDPNIAYNLAVSLDRLGTSTVAADFYRRALTLARTRPGNFDTAQVVRRLRTLVP